MPKMDIPAKRATLGLPGDPTGRPRLFSSPEAARTVRPGDPRSRSPRIRWLRSIQPTSPWHARHDLSFRPTRGWLDRLHASLTRRSRR